ncbi:hypothetical protein ACH5RR_009193 [Cinchona calisaya]|uniref:AB hydrolase-1 domain-containing protein n=1 Tax=Cinchona calisaya TaxID=153742 RepID=A0ABD3AFX5_9GENT
MDVANSKQKKHFILVHGVCHGAWCWYKLKPLLESAGQKATAIDLSASGINTKRLDEIHSLHDYSFPLMELMATIPTDEKVILVGHSYGGLNLALAMENYSEKISVAVFVAAMMPDIVHAPSYPLDQLFKQSPTGSLLDTQFLPCNSSENSRTAMLFGPQHLSSTLYQLCSREDLELAKLLIRPTFCFLEDLRKAKPLSTQGYGSVKRVYILCGEDKAILEDFQRWSIENIGVEEAKEIKDAGHMAMLSKPKEFCQCLLEIAEKYV